MPGIQPGWGSQWETLADAINGYYGGGVGSEQYQKVVQMLNSGEYTMSEMEQILGNIPDFNRTYNANGELIKVTYNAKTVSGNASTAAANAINSNVANGTAQQFESVQSITKNVETGKVTISDNVKKYSTGGTSTNVKAVAGSVVSGVAAASCGVSLGKIFSQVAYDNGFNYLEWAGVDMESLNPQMWATITEGQTGPLPALFNMLFHIDPNSNNPQAYIDQVTAAYMTAYLASCGAFSDGENATGYTPTTQHQLHFDDWRYPLEILETDTITSSRTYFGTPYTSTVHISNYDKIVGCVNPTTQPPSYSVAVIGKNKTPVVSETFREQTSAVSGGMYTTTINGDEYNEFVFNLPCDVSYPPLPISSGNNATNISNDSYQDLTYLLFFNDAIETGTGILGIDNQEGATQFNVSGISDYSDINAVLNAMQQQYPELWESRIEYSPDGETTQVYIPVGFPTGGTGDLPTTEGATQSQLAPDITGDGQNATDELIKTLIEMIQNPQNQNGMDSDINTPVQPGDTNTIDTGTGSTPTIVIPTGSASALYSIYNPTQSQLNSFGAWLWSSNFVDQLLKVFSDPMQAIIGLQKVFATPTTGSAQNIKVGYLDSGVSSAIVTSQYSEVDCGSVNISEYFGNVLDYTYTDIYIYLPFIGIVPLNVSDVMRSTLSVKYKVDVVTGACLASVIVTRDGNAGGQLYTYSGNCAVQYPLSSGSYVGIVAGALSVAGSIAGTIASGGALLPMALGAGASALSSAKTKVEHSGSISGSAGAMGIKTPYLIIRRPQTAYADNFETFSGVSHNKTAPLSSYTGFTRVSYVHLENIPATDNELSEIESLLHNGVFL